MVEIHVAENGYLENPDGIHKHQNRFIDTYISEKV